MRMKKSLLKQLMDLGYGPSNNKSQFVLSTVCN